MSTEESYLRLYKPCGIPGWGPGTRQGALAPGRAEKIEQDARREQFSENLARFHSHELGPSRSAKIIEKRSLREQFSRMELMHPDLDPSRSRAVGFSWTSRSQNLKLHIEISILEGSRQDLTTQFSEMIFGKSAHLLR